VHRWQGRQRRIGLTGGIASGKSSVSKYLQKQGLPVLDADIYAHEALAPGTQATGIVIERYGALVQLTQKSRSEGNAASPEINRWALGQIVFNHAAERLWLEQLIHPIVRKRLEQEIELRSRSSALVLMIPLLFEAGLEELCTEVWVVHCSSQEQQNRLMARNGLSAVDAKRRIQAQWPLEQKRKLADQVIDNNGNIKDWENQILQVL
jgi:dephospho-CoA kinase